MFAQWQVTAGPEGIAGIAWGWWIAFLIVAVLVFVNRTTAWAWVSAAWTKITGKQVAASVNNAVSSIINTMDTYEAQYAAREIKRKYLTRWSVEAKANLDKLVVEAATWDDAVTVTPVTATDTTAATIEALSAQIKSLEAKVATVTQTGA